MKKNRSVASAETQGGTSLVTEKNPTDQKNGDRKNVQPSNGARKNGHATAEASPDLVAILASLQTLRDGDFSVRLPGSWVGLAGKIADTFNDIAAADQEMARELKRLGQVVGKQGKTRERARFNESRGAWGDMESDRKSVV